MALRGILLATVLGPTSFGVWSLLRLGMVYASLANLGIHRGLELEGVRADAQRRQVPGEGETHARTDLGFVLTIFGLIGVAAFLASFAATGRELRLGLRAFAAAIVAEQVWFYGLAYLRISGTLRRFALIEMAGAAAHLLLAALFALLWGLGGALVGLIAGSVVGTGLLSRWVPMRPALDLAKLRTLLGVGLPITGTALILIALGTVDRLAIAFLAGTTQLGYYGFAVSAAGLAGALALVVRTVVFPDVYARLRAEGVAPAVREHLERTLIPFAWLYPPLLGGLALILGPFVYLVVPGYAAAIGPAQIFLFTAVTLGLSSLGAVGLVAARLQRRLPLYALVALLVNLGLSVGALTAGAGLQGVAGAALVGKSLYAGATVALVCVAAGISRPGPATLKLLFPLVYCLILVLVVRRLVESTSVAALPAALGFYGLGLLPLAPVLVRLLARLRA